MEFDFKVIDYVVYMLSPKNFRNALYWDELQ